MKRAWLALLLAVPAFGAGVAGGPTIEPPPGWADANADGKVPNVSIALRGPETSSFIVKRAPSVPLDNPAGVRGYLNDVLQGLRRAQGVDYRSGGRVESTRLRNGVAAQLLRAQLGGQDKMILAVFPVKGAAYLAVLTSNAPEAMLNSTLGALQLGGADGAVQTGGVARSSDGQLEVALGGGLRSRAALDSEAMKGFVFVIQGSGSEVLFQKLAETDATKPSEQAAIVRALAAASAQAAPEKASPVAAAPTAAGPAAVWSWAPAANGEKFAAGYLPWSFWGYQLFARGPQADELLVGALAALKAGPAAVPGLVAKTPRIPIEEETSPRKMILAIVGAAVLVGAVVLLALGARRRG